MKNFSIESQWHIYLKRVGLSEAALPEVQKIEMKKTFFGACGQILFLLRDDIAALPEEEGVVILENMKKEIGEFWLKETNRSN